MFKPKKSFLNAGHRGARSIAPENTLVAAEKALACGADMWEMDVRLTADGELAVIHDATLERTSDAPRRPEFKDRAPWPVHTFTLEELGRLDFGSWFIESDPFNQIAWGRIEKTDLERFHHEPVPTLRQVLAFSKENHFPVNVEIKNIKGLPGDEQIAGMTADLICDMDMVEQVIVSSFNHDYLRQVKSLHPEISVGALVDRIHPDPVGLLKDLKAAAYHPGSKAIDPTQISRLRDQGFMVNVWTVNSYETMALFLAAGATAIMTDFPQELNRLIEKAD